MSNTLTQQDLTEIVTGFRQLYDMRRIMQVNGQNAIVIRDTPDRIALAAKLIRDLDKAKPEVLIHVQVLSADVDRLRDLGILPGQSVSVAFTPRSILQPGTPNVGTTTGSTTSIPQVTLNNLHRLSTADWSITLPGAQANAILTDNNTQIIQDPEFRDHGRRKGFAENRRARSRCHGQLSGWRRRRHYSCESLGEHAIHVSGRWRERGCDTARSS